MESGNINSHSGDVCTVVAALVQGLLWCVLAGVQQKLSMVQVTPAGLTALNVGDTCFFCANESESEACKCDPLILLIFFFLRGAVVVKGGRRHGVEDGERRYHTILMDTDKPSVNIFKL
ncbi:hypothetical protein OH76DRAFT_1424273 [Lentinus brumalis]|uniref:Uncharacterized protein n=1 Tax=Lentinus brumalis TaxID=2498619 RepID=A0A371CGU5_9APHY|nr:hypothetical protein OH76DRAFT_1424273 [Polyporus brumalis]